MIRKLHHNLFRILSFLLLHKTFYSQKQSQKRRHRRQNCHISVDITHDNKHLPAVIRNINAYGALISAQHDFQTGDIVALYFPLHYLDPHIEVKATIVWADFGTAGLQFHSC